MADQHRRADDQQGAEPAGSPQEPPQRGHRQGEKQQRRQGVGKAPVMLEVGQAVVEGKEVIEVGEYGKENPGQRGPDPGGRGGQLGEGDAGDDMGERVHNFYGVGLP